jgi:hypothetical protein
MLFVFSMQRLGRPQKFRYTAGVNQFRDGGARRVPARLFSLAMTLWLTLALALPIQSQPPSDRPGAPAPPEVLEQLQQALTHALARFEARDAKGVLVHVSDAYRTGPLTKAMLREQLIGMFTLYDAVSARVRIDDIRMVGDAAWIYSTGQVTGRLPVFGRWMQVLAWDGELEIARRENGAWRLIGYQQ